LPRRPSFVNDNRPILAICRYYYYYYFYYSYYYFYYYYCNLCDIVIHFILH
jgi:hypothetical protein